MCYFGFRRSLDVQPTPRSIPHHDTSSWENERPHKIWYQSILQMARWFGKQANCYYVDAKLDRNRGIITVLMVQPLGEHERASRTSIPSISCRAISIWNAAVE